MRRIAICTVVIGLLAGVSYATNYNFVGVQTDRTYDWPG